jgi:putative FmdB family regulatory protein
MPLYSYTCPGCGRSVDLRHGVDAVDEARPCPHCGGPLRRTLTPTHHWWPSNHRPGFEASGQRRFLDPNFQARRRDDLHRMQEQ